MQNTDKAILNEQALLWWGIVSMCVISIPILSVYLGEDVFARQFAELVRGGSLLGMFFGLGMFGGIIGVGFFVRNFVKKIRRLVFIRAISVAILLFMMSFLGQHM